MLRVPHQYAEQDNQEDVVPSCCWWDRALVIVGLGCVQELGFCPVRSRCWWRGSRERVDWISRRDAVDSASSVVQTEADPGCRRAKRSAVMLDSSITAVAQDGEAFVVRGAAALSLVDICVCVCDGSNGCGEDGIMI